MTPCVLYLDTSDLSYLARSEVVNGVNYGSLRERITALSRGNQLRLRLSFVQLAEATQLRNGEVFGEGVSFLRSLPNTMISLVSPDSIFRAELDQTPVELREIPLSLVPDRFYDSRLSMLTGLWPLVGRSIVKAQQLSRTARSTDTDSMLALKKAILGGDARLALSRRQQRKKVQPGKRVRLAVAATAPIRAILGRSGLHLSYDSRSQHALQESGLTWIAAFGHERVRRAVSIGERWLKAPSSRMPACALRIAFEHRLYKSKSDEFGSGDIMDPLHLAYAAYSDAATVDCRVHEFTKETQEYLQRPCHLGLAGHLSDTLSYIEKQWK